MTPQRLRAVLMLSLAVGLLPRAALAQRAVIALEHGQVLPVDGPPLEDGTVVFEVAGPSGAGKAADPGRILAVGPSSTTSVPANAVRIDVRGRVVTPGLFDGESRAGLAELAAEHSTVDSDLRGHGAIRAAFAVEDSWNVESVVIPVTRMEGVTTVALAPLGGFVAGRGAVADLGALHPSEEPDMLLRAPSAVYLSLGSVAREESGGARGGLALKLRELVDDVREYNQRRSDFERNLMRHVAASRLDLEALVPAVGARGSKPALPFVVEVHRASDILAALRLARELGLSFVLSGCEEGWRVADAIAAAGTPVIVHPMEDLPEQFDRLGSRLDNPALLARAGVKIAISTRLEEPHRGSTLRFEAGNAVANGLPWEEALRAVTLAPAEIFGERDRLGSLRAGKLANVVVWSGDPFETWTRVEKVYIHGREVPLRSRQTLLRDRYLDLSGMRPKAN